MNYLAHGYRFLDQPLFLAGTAVPDWLSVVDRRVRVRGRRIEEHRASLNESEIRIATGVLQHLKDDDVFHRSEIFLMLESELTVRFRRILPDPYDHRPAFLGHIVTELLLDAFISESNPGILRLYYESLEIIKPLQIEQLVNRVSARQTDRLAQFVREFRSARVLYDYSDNRRLLGRLNQVLHRVTLPALNEPVVGVLQESRELVNAHAQELLRIVESGDTAVS